MKEFIRKLTGRLEELRKCSDFGTCNHCQNRWCPMELLEADEVISIINELAEEYKDINIITDFLQYVRDNADNYDADNGWDLADLIDLSIKFCNAEEYNNDFCEHTLGSGVTSCGKIFRGDSESGKCPYCGKKIKVVE